MTITQTVQIPADRRLVIEVPPQIPPGMAQVELRVVPFVEKSNKSEPPLKCLEGVDTTRVDKLLGAAVNPGKKTYDELREEGMKEKYGEYFK